MTDNHALFMYKYNTWANKTIMEHLKLLPEGICKIDIQSVFPSVFNVLTHIYIIDSGWLSVLSGEYRSDDYSAIGAAVNKLITETKHNSLEEIEDKQQRLADAFLQFITNNKMTDRAVFSWVEMSYGDVVQHIVNHGTYHRGNITAMLHQLGYKGVPTDYGFYLYTIQ